MLPCPYWLLPQQMPVPSAAAMPQLKFSPAATSTASPPGALRSPSVACPQQRARWSVVTPQACSAPTDT
jgi:hypothetical protein